MIAVRVRAPVSMAGSMYNVRDGTAPGVPIARISGGGFARSTWITFWQ
jgi:hypothetical protein